MCYPVLLGFWVYLPIQGLVCIIKFCWCQPVGCIGKMSFLDYFLNIWCFLLSWYFPCLGFSSGWCVCVCSLLFGIILRVCFLKKSQQNLCYYICDVICQEFKDFETTVIWSSQFDYFSFLFLHTLMSLFSTGWYVDSYLRLMKTSHPKSPLHWSIFFRETCLWNILPSFTVRS